MKLNFQIKNEPEGVTIICFQNWNSDLTKLAKSNKVTGISFHPILPHHSEVDLDFLAEFVEIQRLSVSIYQKEPVKNFDQIYNLASLRSLNCQTLWNSELDFTRFPNLQNVEYSWHQGSNLSKCSQIHELCIHNFTGIDLTEFSSLNKIERLLIFSSKMRSLSGLEQMDKLKFLRISSCSKLENTSGLSALRNLEELWIAACRRISNLNAIYGNFNLMRLILDCDGEIESLSPLLHLQNLQELLLIGNTNILDGDFSVLENLSSLRSVSYVDRKHYSHRNDYFDNRLKNKGES